MKITALFASLALAPALLMADPEPVPAPSASETNAPAGPEDLAEHAALVQRLGADAARGFDSEAHAHNLRLQMQQLVSASVAETASTPKPPAPTRVPAPPHLAQPVGSGNQHATPALASAKECSNQSVQQAIQKVRLALSELEAKVQAVAPSGAYHPNQ